MYLITWAKCCTGQGFPCSIPQALLEFAEKYSPLYIVVITARVVTSVMGTSPWWESWNVTAKRWGSHPIPHQHRCHCHPQQVPSGTKSGVPSAVQASHGWQSQMDSDISASLKGLLCASGYPLLWELLSAICLTSKLQVTLPDPAKVSPFLDSFPNMPHP